jgi:hypothetical protein
MCNVESTSEATGISESLLGAILKQGARTFSAKRHIAPSVLKGKPDERRKAIVTDDFAEGEMKRKIHEFLYGQMNGINNSAK